MGPSRRVPTDMMSHGRSTSLFQLSQLSRMYCHIRSMPASHSVMQIAQTLLNVSWLPPPDNIRRAYGHLG